MSFALANTPFMSASQRSTKKCPCKPAEHPPSAFSGTGVQLHRQFIGLLYNRRTHAHDPVTKFTWTNANFMSASVMTYGATVMHVTVPNKFATCEDVLCGFDTLDEYVQHGGLHFGAVIGRCANIIAGAEYETRRCDVVELDGNEPARDAKEAAIDATCAEPTHHHLDGGRYGLGTVNWSAYTCGTQVIMSHVSPDGDQGYPGALMVQVRFAMTDDNRLQIAYMAQCDCRTPVNLSHRLYLNMAGHAAGREALREHVFNVNARRHVEHDGEHRVPTGKLTAIGESECDCRVASELGKWVRQSPLGYFRETFLINSMPVSRVGLSPVPPPPPKPTESPKRNFVTRVVHPRSGRVVEIYSSQRCVEFATCHHFPYVPEDVAHGEEEGGEEEATAEDMCANIINEIVSGITNTGRYLRQDVIKELVDRVCNIQMAMDGTIPTDVARELLDDVCKELQILREHEANAEEGEEEIEEEEDGDLRRPILGKDGAQYLQNCAFYAQTQNYPDAVHHRGRFGDVLLEPGQTYRHDLVYKFGLHMGSVLPTRVYLNRASSDSDTSSVTTRSSSASVN